jgi:diguanylate cyclase (GGDEF)-like protein
MQFLEYLWRRGRFYIYSPKLVAFDHLELLEHPFITERLTNYRDIPHLNQNVAGRKLFDQLIESHEDILFLRLRAFVSDIIFDFENRSNRLEIKSYKHLAENYVDCLIDHRVFSFAWAEHIDENGQKKMVYANWIYSRLENFLQKLGLFQKNGLKKFYPMIMNLIFSGADPYHDLLRIGIKKKKGSYVQEVNNFLNAKILLLQRQGLLGETESKIIIYLAHFFIQFFKKLEGIDYFSYFPTLDYSRPDPIIGMFSGLYRKHQNLETLDLLLKGIPSNSKLTPVEKDQLFRNIGTKIISPILNHYFEIFWNRHLNQQVSVRGSINDIPVPLLVYNEKGICVDGNILAFTELGYENNTHQLLNFSFDKQKNTNEIEFEELKEKIKKFYDEKPTKTADHFQTTLWFKAKNGRSIKMLARVSVSRISQRKEDGLFYSFYLQNIKKQALEHHYHQIVAENFYGVETPMVFMTAEDGTITEGSYPWLKTVAGLSPHDLSQNEYVLFLKSKKNRKLYTNIELGYISEKRRFKRIGGRFDAFIIKKSELGDFLDSKNHWQTEKLLTFIKNRKASAVIDAGINSIKSHQDTLELLHVQGKDISDEYDVLVDTAYSKAFYAKEFKKRFQIYLNSSKRKGFSYLFLDIDNFKAVNDNYGHEAGDQILIEFGKAISRSLRTSDYFFRNGGEEFVVILPGVVTEDLLRQIDTRLHDEVEKVVRPDGTSLRFTAGAVILNQSSLPFSEPTVVNTLADMMMYQFKRTRKGLTNIFNMMDAAHVRIFRSINSDHETESVKKLAQ